MAEIDLREEFLNTIFGAGAEVPKGMTVLIRRLRRDSLNFARTACPCRDPITREPDLDTICPSCLGVGFLWDEEWGECYKVGVGSETSIGRRREHLQAGILYRDTYRFYFPYDVNLLEGDTIIELVLDVEGNIDQPARRYQQWTPSTIEVKRLDNGRVEFYIVSCQRTGAILIDKENFGFIENP